MAQAQPQPLSPAIPQRSSSTPALPERTSILGIAQGRCGSIASPKKRVQGLSRMDKVEFEVQNLGTDKVSTLRHVTSFHQVHNLSSSLGYHYLSRQHHMIPKVDTSRSHLLRPIATVSKHDVSCELVTETEDEVVLHLVGETSKQMWPVRTSKRHS